MKPAVLLCGIALLFCARPALADPIGTGGASPVAITGGFGTAEPYSGTINISGQDFSIATAGELGFSVCFPCQPGANPFQLSFDGEGPATNAFVNGRSWPGADVALSLPLTGTMVIPDTSAASFVVSAPFTLGLGTIGVYPSATNDFPPIANLRVYGAGVAAFTFTREANTLNGVPLYDTSSAVFTFTPPSSPSPTPEPSTILMLASGLIGVAARFRCALV